MTRQDAHLKRLSFGGLVAGAFLLGLAVMRFLRRSRTDPAVQAPSLTSHHPLGESRMPRHDRPSGYFSARGEGTITNTPQTRSPR
jgi:hypothetical protein